MAEMTAAEAVALLRTTVADFEIELEQCHEIAALIEQQAATIEALKCCGNCRQQDGNPYFECAYMDVESYNESGCRRCSEWEQVKEGQG